MENIPFALPIVYYGEEDLLQEVLLLQLDRIPKHPLDVALDLSMAASIEGEVAEAELLLEDEGGIEGV